MPSVVQVLVWPLAPRPLGVAIALVSTLPIAWRLTHPAAAAVVGTLPWCIPTDGYVVVGFIAAFVLFYSLGAHVADLRVVVAVTVFGVALSVLGSWLNHEVPGEYMGAVTAFVLPALVGPRRAPPAPADEQLEQLTAELEHERERTAQLAVAEERARIARELHDVVAHGAERDRDPGRRRRGRARPRPGARPANL